MSYLALAATPPAPITTAVPLPLAPRVGAVLPSHAADCQLARLQLPILAADPGAFQDCFDQHARGEGSIAKELAQGYMAVLACHPQYQEDRVGCLSSRSRPSIGQATPLPARVYIWNFCEGLASAVREYIRAFPDREKLALSVGHDMLQSAAPRLLAGFFSAAPTSYHVSAQCQARLAARAEQPQEVERTAGIAAAASGEAAWQRGLEEFYLRHVLGDGLRHHAQDAPRLHQGEVRVVGADALALAQTYLPPGVPQVIDRPLPDLTGAVFSFEEVEYPAGIRRYAVEHGGEMVALELADRDGPQFRITGRWGDWEEWQANPQASPDRYESQVAALQDAIRRAGAGVA